MSNWLNELNKLNRFLSVEFFRASTHGAGWGFNHFTNHSIAARSESGVRRGEIDFRLPLPMSHLATYVRFNLCCPNRS